MSMCRFGGGVAACLLAFSSLAAAPFSDTAIAEARALRERALADDTGYELIRSLTTEVGPRLAGTPGDARAVAWALAKLESLGFENVRAEPVTVPRWIRGDARAEIIAPWPQPLVVVALGGSVGTPAGGLEGDVVPVASVDDLKAQPRTRIAGRIVFFTNRMQRSRDGSDYSRTVTARIDGAAAAAALGAVAMVMRPAGTSASRTPHTGSQHYADGVPPIPAFALSNPDADLLEQQLASGRTVRLRLASTSRWDGEAQSANVIGEIRGRSRPEEVVVLGAHLDSWDLGTGAHDDGAGIGIVTAAARLVGEAPQRPKRTLRVVLFANEEFGLSGAKAYAASYRDTIDKHVLAVESDLGAFQPYGLRARTAPDRLPTVRAMQSLLEPLGVTYLGNETGGGADVGRLGELGVPMMYLETDAAPYFDLHHTANDTFDKVDPAMVRLNVAAFAVIAYLAAEADGGFGRLPAIAGTDK